MTEICRRDACRTAATLLSGVPLAGCSASDEEQRPGAPVTVDGLEIVYTGYELAESLRPGGTGTATGGDNLTDTGRQTPITPAEERSFLGVAFRMTNDANGPRQVPMPRPAPVHAQGEIHLLFNVAAHRRKNPPSIRVGPTIETGEGVVESLTHTLGEFQAELSPGEEVSGWAFYPIPEDVAVQDIRVVIAELDLGGRRAEWRVTDE